MAVCFIFVCKYVGSDVASRQEINQTNHPARRADPRVYCSDLEGVCMFAEMFTSSEEYNFTLTPNVNVTFVCLDENSTGYL